MEKEAIAAIRERIASACARSRRAPAQVTLIAVTKGRPVQQIRRVLGAGVCDIGENKMQEVLLKYDTLTAAAGAPGVRWHMIGHLQTNKVKQAVTIFDLIHSVDSVQLGREIDRRAAAIGKVQDVLIEVNTSAETAKYGVAPADAPDVVKQIALLDHVRVRGLMTMAPVVGRAEEARPFFQRLRLVLDRINAAQITGQPLQVLSMGMSDDFEVAIEEGATMIRVGRALFDYDRE
ncbi:MAG TPA: YggS family pyridoxal phosphate-dependent enzyme [Candidatus Omnitrophota bacterium]|nr:YggS family pyridoxal phosphate-dependent enzyme [Candidatus Omnitrophota bacterium]HRZ15258.1 YggS family pyridoxal phosphate-dependent enzyme [Candidatus Omnitrophota bacterium]